MTAHDLKISDVDEPEGSPDHYMSIVSLYSTWRVAFQAPYAEKWFAWMVLKLQPPAVIYGQIKYRLLQEIL